MKIDDLEILFDKREVTLSGAPLKMSSRAFDILRILAEAEGETVATDRLLSEVWPTTVVEESNIQVHICGLRRALGDRRYLIKTETGKGYRLAIDKEAPGREKTSTDGMVGIHMDARPFPIAKFAAPLFGRRDEMNTLFSALNDGDRITTIVGAPGVGKSRLAWELGRRLEKECGFQVFQVQLAGVNALEAQQRIAEALKACRHSVVLRFMILLDDCDHSTEAVIDAIENIDQLEDQHRPVVVATCRSPLRVPMESVFRLDALSTERIDESHMFGAAVELFFNRLRALSAELPFDQHSMERVNSLIEHLDGLPYAIEIAARQVALLGIDAVLSLIEENMSLSVHKICRQYDERHSSLHSAWASSWSKLASSEQLFLKTVSQLSGPLTFESLAQSFQAQQGTFSQCVDSISALIEASFLQRSSSSLPHQYKLPSTLRGYLSRLQSLEHEYIPCKESQPADGPNAFALSSCPLL